MATVRSRFPIVVALVLATATPLSAESSDSAAIRQTIRSQEAVLNAHDASAYGQLLEDDAGIVTSLGWWVKGKTSYTQKLNEAFAGPKAKAHVHAQEVDIRMLGSDFAIAHIKWTDDTARKDNEAIESQVLHKQLDGRWLIAALQETEVKPERSFAMTNSGEAPAPAAVPQPTRNCLVARGNGDCLIYK